MSNKATEMTHLDYVHCLLCDAVWEEKPSKPKKVCPICGNADMNQTVYLMKGTESEVNNETI